MRTAFFFLTLFICMSFFGVGSVAAADYDFSLSTGYLMGDSTYQIGGRVDDVVTGPADYHFPISELVFPLDAIMLKAEGRVVFSDKWRFSLNVQTNATDDSGKMEDSDWLSPGSLDVFSESDTEMSALLFDGKLSYRLYQGYYGETSINHQSSTNLLFSYSAALGYKHQHFDFDVSNVDQWYPSDPVRPHDRVAGLGLTYEIEYWIPYLELAMDMNNEDKYAFKLGVAYAPVIDVKDEDRHLLRDKVNIADHDWNGSAMFVTANGRYNLTERWSLMAEVEWMNIQSEGRSDAYLSGVYDHTIDHEIESTQFSSFLTVGYSF